MKSLLSRICETLAGSSSPEKSPEKIRSRRLHFEPLENRELLSINIGGIESTYPAQGLGADTDYGTVETARADADVTTPTHRLTANADVSEAVPGGTINLKVFHELLAREPGNLAFGLGITVSYNPSFVEFNLAESSRLSLGAIGSLSHNAATHSVSVGWNDASVQWPGTDSLIELLHLNFTVLETAPAGTAVFSITSSKKEIFPVIEAPNVTVTITEPLVLQYPDLEASNGGTAPASVVKGDTFSVTTGTIKNIGDAVSGGYTVTFYALTSPTQPVTSGINLGFVNKASLAIGGTTTATLNVTNTKSDLLTAETSYYIGWCITGVAGEADTSNNTGHNPTPVFVVTPLETPTNLAATVKSATEVDLEWTESDDATDYEIRYRVEGVGSWSTANVTITDQAATVSGLRPDTSYEFQVRAKNNVSSSPWSASVVERTEEVTMPTHLITAETDVSEARPGDTIVLSVSHELLEKESGNYAFGLGLVVSYDPAFVKFNLADSVCSHLDDVVNDVDPLDHDAVAHTVSVGWNDVDAQWPGTDAVVKLLSLNFTVLEEAPAGVAVFTITSSKAEVFPVIEAEAVEVNIVLPSETPPETPTNLAVVAQSTTEIGLSWTASEDTTGYEVQYCVEGTDLWRTANVVVTGTTATVSHLTPGTAYEFQVRATNEAGDSDWSDSVVGETDEVTTPTHAITAETNVNKAVPGDTVILTVFHELLARDPGYFSFGLGLIVSYDPAFVEFNPTGSTYLPLGAVGGFAHDAMAHTISIGWNDASTQWPGTDAIISLLSLSFTVLEAAPTGTAVFAVVSSGEEVFPVLDAGAVEVAITSPLPDLVASNGGTVPASVIKGNTFSVTTGNIRNLGSKASGNYTVTFYASSNLSTLFTSGINLGSVNMSDLAVGETTTATLNNISTASLTVGESYYIGWRITGVAGEVNTSNNTGGNSTPMLVVTLPDSPKSLSATVKSTTEITLTWAASTGATGYDTQYREKGTSSWLPGPSVTGTGTTVTVGGLTAGKTYEFQVRTKNDAGTSPWSALVEKKIPKDLEILATPTGVTATSVNASSLTVNWNPVTNANGYIVEYSTSSTFASNQSIDVNSGTSTTLSSLVANTTYYVRVIAKGDGEVYGDSNPSGPANALTYPGTPLSFVSTAQTPKSIALTWSAPVGGAASYKLERSPNGTSGWTQIGGTITDTNYTDYGLTPDTTYYYRVSAVNASGTSSPTSVLSAKTQPLAPLDQPVITFSNVSATSLTFSWDFASHVGGYVVQYSTSYTFENALPGTPTGTTTLIDLDANTMYYVRVKAIAADGSDYLDSEWGTASKVTLPNVPTGLTSPSQGTRSILLSWNVPVGGAVSYMLERSPNGTSGWTPIGGTVVGTNYMDSGLNPDTTYYYRVSAVNASGTTAPTSALEVKTFSFIQLASPQGVAATVKDATTLTVSWNDVPNASGYYVEYATNSSFSGSATQTVWDTTCDLTGLTTGTKYYIRVIAVGTGDYVDSPTSAATVVSATPIPPVASTSLFAVAPDAGPSSKPIVLVYDAVTETLLFEIVVNEYGANYTGGLRIATGDINGDGIPDIVVVPGRNAAPTVLVYSGATGQLLSNYCIPASATYGNSFKDGLNVAVGNVTGGNGLNGIVLIPGDGQAVVKVFENAGRGLEPAREFNAFEDNKQYIGGGSITVGNTETSVTSGGHSQIVVGSGVGIAPVVRIFDVVKDQPAYRAIHEIKPTRSDSLGGVNVALGDFNGNGFNELVVSERNAGRSWVDIYLLYPEGGVKHLTGVQAFGPDEGNSVTVNITVRGNDNGVTEILATQGAKGKAGSTIRKLQIDPQTLKLKIVDSILADWSNDLGGGMFIG
ncbi:MAG: fibronectin type III domain-containing protein [Planctomycetaceae bacterium]|nr:fibronectin type III domain-containing protein [Planctomycetaceae bacterium]